MTAVKNDNFLPSMQETKLHTHTKRWVKLSFCKLGLCISDSRLGEKEECRPSGIRHCL